MKFLFSGFFFISILIFYPFLLVSQNIETVIIESNTSSSFRALSVVDDTIAWVSGSKGWIGRTKNGGVNWEFDKVKLFEEMDFRTLFAFDYLNAIIANAGSPAYILRTTDGGMTWLPVYQNSHPEIFLDGVDFWNHSEGVIYGDPIKNKLVLLNTKDAGFTWQISSDEQRPVLDSGEASFAASGTAIRCFGHSNIAIVSGGSKSNLYMSEDKGNSWEKIKLPIIQGKPSTGAFSVAFKNRKEIVIVGGDYLNESMTENHVFYSENGCKKWKLPVAMTKGYRESVEYLGGDTFIATGPTGTEISSDNGVKWKTIEGITDMHVVRKAREGSLVVLAGKNGKIIVVKRLE